MTVTRCVKFREYTVQIGKHSFNELEQTRKGPFGCAGCRKGNSPAKVRQLGVWQLAELLAANHLADVPDFGCLVLAVGQQVLAITLGVDVGYALGMTYQNPGSPSIPAAHAAIPHLRFSIMSLVQVCSHDHKQDSWESHLFDLT